MLAHCLCLTVGTCKLPVADVWDAHATCGHQLGRTRLSGPTGGMCAAPKQRLGHARPTAYVHHHGRQSRHVRCPLLTAGMQALPAADVWNMCAAHGRWFWSALFVADGSHACQPRPTIETCMPPVADNWDARHPPMIGKHALPMVDGWDTVSSRGRWLGRACRLQSTVGLTVGTHAPPLANAWDACADRGQQLGGSTWPNNGPRIASMPPLLAVSGRSC